MVHSCGLSGPPCWLSAASRPCSPPFFCRIASADPPGPLDNAADGAPCCCSRLKSVSFVTLTGWGSAAYHHISITATAAEVDRCVTY